MPKPKKLLIALSLVVALLLLPIALSQVVLHPAWSRLLETVQAETTVPVVRYDATSNTIMVGANYSSAIPAEAEFIHRPGAPDAPKQTITLPQVAEAVAAQSVADRLQDLGNGIWLLKANVLIKQNARLEVNSTLLNELRLESAPVITNIVSPQNFIKILVDGGALEVNGVSVYSWNTPRDVVDTNTGDGRSYIAAVHGGRMDILNAEVSYLGWAGGEFAGLSWRLLALSSDPTSGPTGNIRNSEIHHNYDGVYIKDASLMTVQFNQIHDNLLYGVLLSDASGVIVSNNDLYNNRGHGILLSRQAVHNRISSNKSHNNRWSGIALYRGSDQNEVLNNESYENGRHGVTIYQSSKNQVTQNVLDENTIYGLAINADYDPNDLFDGLAIDNIIEDNTITASQLGVCVRGRADRNTLRGNSISNHLFSGVVIQTGNNQVVNNTLLKNEWGISVLGGPPVIYPPGFLTVTPAIDLPGHANLLSGNLIEENQNGLVIQQGSTNIIGQSAANTIRGNSQHGIYLAQTVDTLVAGNVISGNQETGVAVVDGSLRNRITRNSITNNKQLGIFLSQGNNNLSAPKLLRIEAGVVYGTAPINSRVEIYSDVPISVPAQGAEFQGATNTDATGNWNFLLPETVRAGVDRITAIAIDRQGNTSMFSAPFLFIGGERAAANGLRTGSSKQLEFQECIDDTPDLKSPDDAINGDYNRVKRLYLPIVYK